SIAGEDVLVLADHARGRGERVGCRTCRQADERSHDVHAQSGVAGGACRGRWGLAASVGGPRQEGHYSPQQAQRAPRTARLRFTAGTTQIPEYPAWMAAAPAGVGLCGANPARASFAAPLHALAGFIGVAQERRRRRRIEPLGASERASNTRAL